MAAGHKTGGRRKGTPNRVSQDIRDKLASLGCDPIEGMARIAMDADNPVQLRGKMFAELAQYVIPKRKAIEVTGGIEHRYVVRAPQPAKDVETWAQQHSPTIQ